MPRNNHYKAKTFVNAMPGTGGVISTLADKVGCAWNTAKKYIDEYPTVKLAYDNECSRVTDVAKSVIIHEIVTNRDTSTAKWWVLHKARDEFATRQEITGAGGKDLILVNWDDDKDDTD